MKMEPDFRAMIRWENKSKTKYHISVRKKTKCSKPGILKQLKKSVSSKPALQSKKSKKHFVHFDLPSPLDDSTKQQNESQEKNEEREKQAMEDLRSSSNDSFVKLAAIIDDDDNDHEEEEEEEEDEEVTDEREQEKADQKIKPNSGTTKIKMITPCPILSDTKIVEQVCFPTEYSVPNHLAEELSEMMNISPEFQEKSRLIPLENLSVKARQYSNVMKIYWTLEKIEYLCKVLMKKYKSTLSNIDWLCTNFSQEIPVQYNIETENGPQMFNLYQSHKINLDLWTRRYFGVFCRHKRILIAFRSKELEKYLYPESDDGKTYWIKKLILGTRMVRGEVWYYLITSVCQLKFFEWAINKKVIEYCETHCKEIDNHMKETKKKPKDGSRRRRLCEAAPFQPEIQDTTIQLTRDLNNRISVELLQTSVFEKPK